MHPEEREAVTRGLHIIEQAALDGAEVVRHLQQFTGVRRERTLTLVDLSAIVSDAMDMTKPRWKDEFQAQGNPIAVATNLIPGCLVEGDPAELREMLINLILNALDAMPQGGALQINTAPTEQHVRLTVADTGIGMHPEAQRRAFEPFFTTKGPQSSGLGLSISYGIVQRHGGTIALQSQVGRGTAFTMTFPRTHKRGTDGGPGEIPGAGARGRVLVIDDEPHVAQMLAEVLATAGHAAEIALTGKDGLERLGAGRFDVVFTDLGMPGMNGYEVTRQSKAACPTLPVVLMTGWGIQLDDQQVKAHGVDRLLTKPFNLTHVLRLVQELLPVQ